MLVSYRWLEEYTEVPWGPEELAERLTSSGAKVEGIHYPGRQLEGVVVGEIVEVVPHPTAEGLKVCQVDVGERRITTVTGAPEVEAGWKVPVALPGWTIPGTSRTLREVEVQGVRSEGMLCSEKELGIGDDGAGLMRLPQEVEVGRPLGVELGLDDAVIEFEIYPNRPDCLSVVGIAREVSALTGESLSLPEPPRGGRERSGPAVDVTVSDPDLCPRYCAQVVEGVTIGPSPLWMQQRLRSAGMRPINNVVDVTNFVMLELGQPLHAFDLDRLIGPAIRVRRARPGERIITLDGVERALDPDMLVIADEQRPVAVAGIMGGEETEVTENTRTVLLEAATFHPASVRRTARRLGLHSEASNRFEKGLDPHLPEWAIARAAQLLAEVAGGKPSPVVTDVSQPLPEPQTLNLRPERVNRLLGTDLTPAEMKRCLRALHFGVELTGDGRLQVDVPTYRRDVTREVDLIEEIARIYGYDRIEATLPTGSAVLGGEDPQAEQNERIRQRLIAAGLSEVITFSFMSPRSLGHLRLAGDDPWLQAIPIQNPLSEEQSLLRTNVVTGLIEVVGRNLRRQNDTVRIFEIGAVYRPKELPLTSQPREVPTLGIALTGEAPRTGWGDSVREVDFYDVKGLVEAVMAELGLDARLERSAHPSLHPGRAADVWVDDRLVGRMGELHPDVLEAFDIPQRVYVAELSLGDLYGRARQIRFRPLPKYPAVQRDIAFLAPLGVPAEDIERVMKAEGGELLVGHRLFDVYQGKQIPEGYRSLAYSLTFQSPERTLTDDEVAQVQQQILAALEARYGVRLRG